MSLDQTREALSTQLNLIKEHIGTLAGTMAHMEFSKILCDELELVEPLQKLVFEEKISPKLLMNIYEDVLNYPTLHKMKPPFSFSPPKFYTEEMEEIYGIHRKYIEFVKDENFEITPATTHVKIDFDKPSIRVRTNHDYYSLQQLFINLFNDPEDQKVSLSEKLEFNSYHSILKVAGKEIAIRKNSNQYHILAVIFNTPDEITKEWFFSEIAELIDSESVDNINRYYQALAQIKIKLAKVGFTDVLKTTKKSFKINEKYLF